MTPVDKASVKQKDSNEKDEDLRPEWEKENREIDGSKPDLEEIEEDTSSL